MVLLMIGFQLAFACNSSEVQVVIPYRPRVSTAGITSCVAVQVDDVRAIKRFGISSPSMVRPDMVMHGTVRASKDLADAPANAKIDLEYERVTGFSPGVGTIMLLMLDAQGRCVRAEPMTEEPTQEALDLRCSG